MTNVFSTIVVIYVCFFNNNYKVLLDNFLISLFAFFPFKPITSLMDTIANFIHLFQMVQATIVLEDMIKTEYLRNKWWYWSSFSAASKTSTMSSLALRIYSLDAAILYEKISSDSDPTDSLEPTTVSEPKLLPVLDPAEKTKVTRRSNKKRKEPEG